MQILANPAGARPAVWDRSSSGDARGYGLPPPGGIERTWSARFGNRRGQAGFRLPRMIADNSDCGTSSLVSPTRRSNSPGRSNSRWRRRPRRGRGRVTRRRCGTVGTRPRGHRTARRRGWSRGCPPCRRAPGQAARVAIGPRSSLSNHPEWGRDTRHPSPLSVSRPGASRGDGWERDPDSAVPRRRRAAARRSGEPEFLDAAVERSMVSGVPEGRSRFSSGGCAGCPPAPTPHRHQR